MTPIDPNNDPHGPSKPWQFSLKSLVLTLTGCSVLFGLMAAGAMPVVLAIVALAGVAMAFAMLLVYLANHPRVAVVCIGGIAFLFVVSNLPRRDYQSRRPVAVALPQPPDTAELCRENLRQIAAALNAYHNVHGRLPPAYTEDAQGNRLHSWRTLILPHLGHEDLYRQIRLDEPWDSPFNRRFHRTSVNVFACPANSGRVLDTNYVAVTGAETAWPGSEPISLDQIDNETNTILVVEVADSGIHWMEPSDLDFERIGAEVEFGDSQKNMSCSHYAGINVVYADGSVSSLSKGLPRDQLAPLFTITSNDDTIR